MMKLKNKLMMLTLLAIPVITVFSSGNSWG